MFKNYKAWSEFFKDIKEKDFSVSLNKFLDDQYSRYKIYPPRDLMFNAFKLTPLSAIKVVIIGQDPYHEPNQAMGLSFSVPNGQILPPSLKNIYKEISNEYGRPMDYTKGDLTYLAKQGVFLLNSILTVQEHNPLSHDIEEYHEFLKNTLQIIDRQFRPIVFLLWGGSARKLKKYLNNPNHLVLEANHPSPLSANRGGWFGCNHFVLANEYLENGGLETIKWLNINSKK